MNWVLPPLHGGSLEIMLTVSLTNKSHEGIYFLVNSPYPEGGHGVTHYWVTLRSSVFVDAILFPNIIC